MRVAKLIIRVLEFLCPHCGENLTDNSGSQMFDVDRLSEEMHCAHCGLKSKMPAKAKQYKKE